MTPYPFTLIDWESVPKILYEGDSGTAEWQTIESDGLRIRIVHYSRGYIADHWCQKGHIVHCLEGEFQTELKDGTSHTLTKGKGYMVSDGMSNHRSTSEHGTKLLIIDGDFLKNHTQNI
jgi:hypothetical protein